MIQSSKKVEWLYALPFITTCDIFNEELSIDFHSEYLAYILQSDALDSQLVRMIIVNRVLLALHRLGVLPFYIVACLHRY